jgi:hypothetical protein
VLWVDEELGDDLADRLNVLKVEPDLVEELFLAYQFPGWKMEDPDPQEWNIMVRSIMPDLVVFDTATDMLSEADLDENKGVEVTRWVKKYCEPPKRVGAAVVVLDHTTKQGTAEGRGYAVGSRAKKAKAKVQYELETKEGFSKNDVGKVFVTEKKNTISAAIPRRRKIIIGGSPFSFNVREATPTASESGASPENEQRIRIDVQRVLQEAPEELTSRQIRDLVRGKNAAIDYALKEMSQSPLWGIVAEPLGRSVIYRLVQQEGAPDGVQPADSEGS